MKDNKPLPIELIEPGHLQGWYTTLPPSLNDLYRPIHNPRVKHGPQTFMVMTKHAQKWMKTFMSSMAPYIANIHLDPASIYRLNVVYFSAQFLRKRIGKKDGYEERVRRIDKSNLVKLAEDCISELTGVDDSHFWRGEIIKHAVPDSEPDSFYFELRRLPNPW
jgi:hypothetical protein